MAAQNGSISWSIGGLDQTLRASVNVTGESLVAYGPTSVGNGVSNRALDVTLDVSEVSFVWMKSTVDMTLKTNSTSSPTDTISLAANKPLVWFTGCYYSNPLTADVTQMYITNASGLAGTFEMRALPTPT